MQFRSSISRVLLSAAVAFVLTFGASSAFAATILPTPHASEHDLHDILAADGYSHAGSIAELNANQSMAEIFGPLAANNDLTLLIEDAGYRDHNELGIYSILEPGRSAGLFEGSADAPSNATLTFGAGGLEEVNGVAIDSGFGFEFGFYLANADKSFVWFSEDERNSDGFDHFVAFEEEGVLWGGFEDLAGGGDEDFNDLVFSMRGVVGSTGTPGTPGEPIPEPSAALVFAAGLLVITYVRRASSQYR